MEITRKSPGFGVKIKKKMTKEQMQLAIIKKKECDAKALAIVERLLEPQIDSAWLIENLKNINRCHMEDVIEERAITKLCGYVLCQKPLTVIINQRYHISLKSKKVFDVTKRKNFCSSSCFGASNYLLAQMLTSPLWMRDKEEIPEFRIFTKTSLTSSVTHGEEINITLIEHCSKDEEDDEKNPISSAKDSLKEKSFNIDDKDKSDDVSIDRSISGNIQNFVYETLKNMEINSSNSIKTEGDNIKLHGELKTENAVKNIKLTKNIIDSAKINNNLEVYTTNENSASINNLKDNIKSETTTKIEDKTLNTMKNNENNTECISELKVETVSNDNQSIRNVTKKLENICNNNESREVKDDKADIIKQYVYPVESKINFSSSEQNIVLKSNEKTAEQFENHNNLLEKNVHKKDEKKNSILSKEIENHSRNEYKTHLQTDKSEKSQKSKYSKKVKQMENKTSIDINLASRVETSFQEWVTEDTIHFLYGDDSFKQKAIEKIEQKDKYSLLCEKLNRLQFQDEQEDVEILEKPVLKPAPHFAILKEEGEKLNLKVHAFYQGKTIIKEPVKSDNNDETTSSETFLPLTEAHAPQILRRKIFLDKLDQILPDLLRTLAGNNEVYEKDCVNYTSLRCTAVKALIHTFFLSAKNIIFKTAEWTLVGLVIIKMLSLLDPWLVKLLSTKQANMYISMILTSYKLDPHYLNLLVDSFNPNMNLR